MAWQLRWIALGVPPANLKADYGHTDPGAAAAVRSLSVTGSVRVLATEGADFATGTVIDAFDIEPQERMGDTDHALSFYMDFADADAIALAEGDFIAVGLGWTGDVALAEQEVFRGIVCGKTHNHSSIGTDTWGFRCDSLLSAAMEDYYETDAIVAEERILVDQPNTGDNAQTGYYTRMTQGIVSPTTRSVIEALKPNAMQLSYEANDYPIKYLDANGKNKLQLIHLAAQYAAARVFAHGVKLVVQAYNRADDHADFIYTDDEMFELAPERDERAPIRSVTISSDEEMLGDNSYLEDTGTAAVYGSDPPGSEVRPNQQREQTLLDSSTTILETHIFVWRPEPGQEYCYQPPDPLFIPMLKSTLEVIKLFPELITIDPPTIQVEFYKERHTPDGLGYDSFDEVGYFVIPLNYTEIDASKWYDLDAYGNRVYKLRGRIVDFGDFINPDNSDQWPFAIGLPGIQVTLNGQTTGASYQTTTDINGYFLVTGVQLDDYEVVAEDIRTPPYYYGNLEDNDPDNNTVIALKSIVNALDSILAGANYQLMDTPIRVVVARRARNYNATSNLQSYDGVAAEYSRNVEATYGEAFVTGRSLEIYDENYLTDEQAVAKAEEIVGTSQEAQDVYTVVAIGNPLLRVGMVLDVRSAAMGISGNFRVDAIDRDVDPSTGRFIDRIRSVRLDELDALYNTFMSREDWQNERRKLLKQMRTLDRRTKELAGIGSFKEQLPGGKDHG